MVVGSRVPFVNVGTFFSCLGNAVTPRIDGESAFARICEAIESAQYRVWATVSFLWPTFEMPGGRGSALDVFGRAARRGLDVSLIFWRPDEETANLRTNAIWGSPAQQELLARCYPSVNIRWDRAAPGYCQHQKTWLIDASNDGGTSFIGGINLNPHSVARRDHQGAHENHDVYIEVAGPAVADVCHNFVQRWNEASERELSDGLWGPKDGEPLEKPRRLPATQGEAVIQFLRLLLAGLFLFCVLFFGGVSFPIGFG